METHLIVETPTRTGTGVDQIKAGLASAAGPVTSTMNFVVWIDDAAVRDRVIERATKIAEKHPARTLVFDADPVRSGEAAVSQTERAPHETETAQGDRIVIGLGPDEHGRACALLSELRAPDLPTVLWWAGDRIVDEPAFDAIVGCGVETVVLDSSGLVSDRGTIRDLPGFPARHPDTKLHDLAWLRLRPWHDMIAHFFDDPALVEELFAVRRVAITSGSDAEALYLASWLANRLGWNASGRNAFTDRSGGTIAFEHTKSGAARRVREVVLATQHSSYCGRVRADDERIVEVWSEGANAREPRMVPLQAIDNASLIERAILEPDDDALFRTVLGTVKTVLG